MTDADTAISEEAELLEELLPLLAVPAVLSLFLTVVVSGGGLLGVLIALCFAVPIGFVLTVGSLRIIDNLVGPGGASVYTTVS